MLSILKALDTYGVEYPQSKAIFDINCPFCDDTHKHLNVNTCKNVWRCNRCGLNGGVIYFATQMNGITKREAFVMFNDDNEAAPIIQLPEYTASCEELDKTYRAMLLELSLESKDMESLMGRGLTKREIFALNLKSTPQKKLDFEIAQKLLAKGCKLEGVAGFVKYKGRWALYCCASGILIPYINVDNKLVGFQIRIRTKSKGNKYFCLSSYKVCLQEGYSNGSKTVSCAHLIGYNKEDYVCLTEGALKGDVSYAISRRKYKKRFPFLCIAGVTKTKNLESALSVLQKRGVKKVYDFFDMDKVENTNIFNPKVKSAVDKIQTIVESYGMQFIRKTWNPQYKGIDDMLNENAA